MTTLSQKMSIGIDGGGTGCRVVLRQGAGASVVEGTGGAANIMTDPEAAIGNVVAAVNGLLATTGRDVSAMQGARIHLGLAGVVDDRHDAALAAAFPVSSVSVSDDRLTTLAGALGTVDGSVAGIGTGSFIGRRDSDTVRFVGGWGGIVGDQSSGAWLGKRALEDTLKAHDGLIARSPLVRDLLAEFGGPVGLVNFARSARPGDFATFAPKVVARPDDAVAHALLKEGAAYILSALTTLGARPGERVIFAGGLGRFYKAHLPQDWHGGFEEPLGTALSGALQLAERPG